MLNKQHKYRGYTFNIGVELHTKAERHMDGKVWHTITVNDMGLGSYYKKYEVEGDVSLKINLRMDVPYNIERYVDELIDGKKGIEKDLADMGYE